MCASWLTRVRTYEVPGIFFCPAALIVTVAILFNTILEDGFIREIVLFSRWDVPW